MKKTFLSALVLGAAATAVLAQEPAVPAPAPTPAPAPAAGTPTRPPRIAVIDMGEVSGRSVLGKSYSIQLDALRNEINTEKTKKETEIQKLDAQLKALQDELEKQGSVLSPEAADRKRQEIVRKGRERQAIAEDSEQELQRMVARAQQQQQALNAEFQQKIRPHIEAVAKERGIDILLDSQVAITVSKEFDISQAVVSKADVAEAAKPRAAATPRPAAPAPAASSPAPAAPRPTPTPSPGSPSR